MSDERLYAHYVKRTAAVLAAGLALVLLFVAVVDPYRLHGWVSVAGFNQVKPGLDHYQQEIKLAGALAVRPKVVIVGNSRAEIGLDPDSKALGGRTAYNLAIPGTGIDTARRELDTLYAAGAAPETLVIGAEFVDFLVDPAQAEPRPEAAKGITRYQWKVDTLFSVDALFDAVQTLRIQHNPEARTVTAHGFNPLHEYKRFVRDEGHHAIFLQRARENARNLARKPHALVTASGTSPDWKAFDGLLDAGAGKVRDIHVVIYPYHAQLMATFDAGGLGPLFESWKQMLVQRVAHVQAKYPQATLTVWDFSGYGALQCETIPPKGSKAQAKWYWEAGHFKSALGELMLARIMHAADARSLSDDFGVKLNAGSLPANSERIARERSACRAKEPRLFTDVADMVASLGTPR